MSIFNMFKKSNNKKEMLNNNIGEDYIKETESYILEISSDCFDDESLKYGEEIIKKYFETEDSIFNYYLDIELREFYNTNYGYTDDYIKKNLGRPHITIIEKNMGNANYKFTYAGIIEYSENNLDEHMISIEFHDDLKFDNYMQFNG